jgi:hypothetical protein
MSEWTIQWRNAMEDISAYNNPKYPQFDTGSLTFPSTPYLWHSAERRCLKDHQESWFPDITFWGVM